METINHKCYVSLEIAKLLKEAGFDWECREYYYNFITTGWSLNFDDNFVNWNSWSEQRISAPTLDVAQRWLREIKHLDISIHYDPTIKSQPYVYFIYDVEEKFNDILGIISPVTHSYSDGYFYTYEEAQEAGIKKTLEIILQK